MGLQQKSRHRNDFRTDSPFMNILVLNAGSSTLKFKLIELRDATEEQPHVLASGLIDKWNLPQAELNVAIVGKEQLVKQVVVRSATEAAMHQPPDIGLPVFARIAADDALHRGVGFERRRVHRHRLAFEQLLPLGQR